MRQSEYPKYEQKQKDCFASNYGRCQCLTSTNFKGECPFYKSKRK